ncbi:SMP-30/gluconolactonase/LRE family protein [Steroidobacter sp. S1-65]|uniref:SMP-30/gluconolactonase/LRE family protein n=1 Tax=Steroidobacter gossypii TaxID=2805490 RepID=A0ABS1X3C5_9GAMM|nr:SMP-30/gluconolactonase/LRE family protein [Steroidobacter gossypii]MBM0107728.1 SMP-30/gluconolactonase/LRE family protein [Steroidobacter gossypii]
MAESWRVIAREQRDELGEGPLWSARHNAIFWVDILSKFVYRYSLADHSVQSWAMPERIGWVIERSNKPGFIAGLQSGFYELELEPFALRPIVDPEPEFPGNRLNDAKADRHGRIWAGTMDADIVETRGSLYCLRPDLSVRRVDEGYKVTNGPTFSLTQDAMYHTDTGLKTIYRFDLSPEGELSNKRVWLKFTDEMGNPDGMTVDSEGFIWIAHWDGARVSRWSPDAKLDREIRLPAPRITSMTFAGPELDRLFVTSAAKGLDRDKERYAGALFEVDAGGVRGLPPGSFAG